LELLPVPSAWGPCLLRPGRTLTNRPAEDIGLSFVNPRLSSNGAASTMQIHVGFEMEYQFKVWTDAVVGP
jgi:hypothetical protein